MSSFTSLFSCKSLFFWLICVDMQVTVGAGLPIMNILKKDLLQTGDKV